MMDDAALSRALAAWLDRHPLSRRVFPHVYHVERALRRRHMAALHHRTVERALAELQRGGFDDAGALGRLNALEADLWMRDPHIGIQGIEVSECEAATLMPSTSGYPTAEKTTPRPGDGRGVNQCVSARLKGVDDSF